MAKKITLNDLGEHEPLMGGIVSMEGVSLYNAGDYVGAQEIDFLRDFKFDPVYLADDEEDHEATIAKLRYLAKPIDSLGESDIVAVPISDAENRLLAEAGEPLAPDQRAALKAQGVTEVLVEKPLSPDVELRLGRFFMRIAASRKQTRMISKKMMPTIKLDEATLIADPAVITEENIEAAVEAATFDDAPSGEPLIQRMPAADTAKPRPTAHVKKMVEVHDDIVRMAEQIFAQIRASKNVSRDLIAGLSSKVVTGLINDRAFVLNLSGMRTSKHYIVSHSLNTTLLSVTIASTLGYSQGQVLAVAYGAFLHDIGMMRIPPEIVTKAGPLTQQERLTIQRHPVIGLNILQSVSGLPKSAPMVVYQENERTDGSGYPKGRGPALIHGFAKIVAVAATYDAMTHDRPWRKAKLPYHAMEELLNLVNQRKYDSPAARALLRVMSLFPVGSWVRLGDGSLARVVGANPHSFTRPIISTILDPAGKQISAPSPVNLADKANEDIRIVEPVPAPVTLAGDLRTIGF